MSVEQLKSAILELGAEERSRLVMWLDEHRTDLFRAGSKGSGLTAEQEAEVRRRRQEYREHPERFVTMDEKSLEEMFARIRDACTGVPSLS